MRNRSDCAHTVQLDVNRLEKYTIPGLKNRIRTETFENRWFVKMFVRFEMLACLTSNYEMLLEKEQDRSGSIVIISQV